MATKLGGNPEVAHLLKRMPGVSHPPLVSTARLREIVIMFKTLPGLEYPIHSAAEMVSKYTSGGQTIAIAGINFDPVRAIKAIPAHYFPIASIENFIEKIAALMGQQRKKTFVPAGLAELKQQLPAFHYPIRNGDEMLKMATPGRRYMLHGRELDPKSMIPRIPGNFFPIKSEADLDSKISTLLVTGP